MENLIPRLGYRSRYPPRTYIVSSQLPLRTGIYSKWTICIVFKFSIKGLLVLIALVSLCVALVLSRVQLRKATAELESQRAKAKADLDALRVEHNILSVKDSTKIKAVAMPRLLGFNMWQWRVYVPPEQRFRIRIAYDKQSSPSGAKDDIAEVLTDEILQPGESILSVALNNTDGQWLVRIGFESADQSLSSSEYRVRSSSTKWLDDGRIGAIVNGSRKGGNEGDPAKPFVLLRLLDRTPPTEGSIPDWGAMLWIEEIPEVKNGG